MNNSKEIIKYISNGLKSSSKILNVARCDLKKSYSSENLEFYMRAWAFNKAYENLKIKFESNQGYESFKQLNSAAKRVSKFKDDSIFTVSDDYFQLILNENAREVYSNFLDFLNKILNNQVSK